MISLYSVQQKYYIEMAQNIEMLNYMMEKFNVCVMWQNTLLV